MASVVTVTFLLVQSVQSDCFARNGVHALGIETYTTFNGYLELLPCGRDTNNCCLWKEKCGSNPLCIDPNDSSWRRQYCFDDTWKNCSLLAPEYDAYGVVLQQCEANIFCYPGTDCCTTGAKRYYVDPNTGEVQDAPVPGFSTADPIWWKVDSIAILREARTLSTLPSSIPTIEASISSASFTDVPTSMPTSMPTTACQSGLSAGASAGIGIGCATAGAGIAALACFLLCKRKHRRLLQAQATQAMAAQGQDTAQYRAGGAGYTYQEAPRQELEYVRPRHEML